MKNIRFFIISVICISFTLLCTQCDKKEKKDSEILTNKSAKKTASDNNLRAPSIPDNLPWGRNSDINIPALNNKDLPMCIKPPVRFDCYDPVIIDAEKTRTNSFAEFDNRILNNNLEVGKFFSDKNLWYSLFPEMIDSPNEIALLASGEYYMHKTIRDNIIYYKITTDKYENSETNYLFILPVSIKDSTNETTD